jgi:hypothetical protein
MAWKRGTNNNQAGEIRMGHVKEFQAPTSKAMSVSGRLKIIKATEEFRSETAAALVCARENGLPSALADSAIDGMMYLHAHAHPRTILSAVPHPKIPAGCIALNEEQLANVKVRVCPPPR